jgi:hypothetical protein
MQRSWILLIALAAMPVACRLQSPSGPTSAGPADPGSVAAGGWIAGDSGSEWPAGPVGAQSEPDIEISTRPRADAAGRITGPAPLTVTFNGCRCHDPDPRDALNWTFDFGDGGTFARRCRVEHTYAAGRYEATVCVKDRRLAGQSCVCRSFEVVATGGEEAFTITKTISETIVLAEGFSGTFALVPFSAWSPAGKITAAQMDGLDSVVLTYEVLNRTSEAGDDRVGWGIQLSNPPPALDIYASTTVSTSAPSDSVIQVPFSTAQAAAADESDKEPLRLMLNVARPLAKAYHAEVRLTVEFQGRRPVP